jgi:hypothetical protein
MKKTISKSTLAVLMVVCLLATATLAVFFGARTNVVQAHASAPQQNENYGTSLTKSGYNLDNLIPFRDFAESRGFIIEDEQSLNDFAENFFDLYNEAMEFGIIVPLDKDILMPEFSLIQPMWGAGKTIDSDNTGGHQRIAREAYKYVQELFPSVFDPLIGNFSENANPYGSQSMNDNILTRYADYPDIVRHGASSEGDFLWFWGNGMGGNYDHFYNANNKGNYFNGSVWTTVVDDHTAKSRAIQHYNAAVSFWNSGNKTEAYKSLGKSLHFIGDLSTPHHVGDQLPGWLVASFAVSIGGMFLPPPLNSAALGVLAGVTIHTLDMLIGHSNFESTVDNQMTAIIQSRTSNGAWNLVKDYSDKSLDNLIEDIVATAYTQYPSLNMFSNHTNIAWATVPNAVDASISVLMKFATDIGALGFRVENNSTGVTIFGVNNHKRTGTLNIPSTLLGKAVTAIGNSAFANAMSSETHIPSTLGTIGKDAFKNNVNLKTMNLYNAWALYRIGEGAFQNCVSLETVFIRHNVTFIERNAFAGTDSLTIYTQFVQRGSGWDVNWNPSNRVVHWASLSLVEGEALYILVSEGSSRIAILNRYLGSATSFTVPYWVNGGLTHHVVTEIAGGAFAGTNVTNVTVSHGVKTIGAGAFPMNTAVSWQLNFDFVGTTLTRFHETGQSSAIYNSFSIPNFITAIANSAFTNARVRNVVVPHSVTSIGAFAFFSSPLVNFISVYSSNPNFTSQNGIVYNKAQTEIVAVPRGISGNLVLPNTLRTIDASAFSGCTSLRSITIPSSVTNIGEWAFSSCSSLVIYAEALNANGWASNWNSSNRPVYFGVNANTFTEQNGAQYVLQNGNAILTRYIGTASTFSVPSTVIIGGASRNVTGIGASAFTDRTNLTSIVLSSSVTSIGASAFSGCTSLTNITIPSSVTSIGASAFSDCRRLIIYAAVLNANGWASNWNPSNRPVHWGINNSNFTEQSGAQYVLQNGNAILTRYIGSASTFTVPSTVVIGGASRNVTSIGSDAFRGNTSLTRVTISSAVTTIGEHAFADSNTSLTIFTDALSRPGGWSPNWNSSNRTVIWGVIEQDGVQYRLQGGNAVVFEYVGNASSFVIPSTVIIGGTSRNVTSIGSGAFANNVGLTSITIPASVTSIGTNAFQNCTGLRTVTFVAGSQPLTIGNNAFSGCTSLPNITIPSRVTSIGESAFLNNTSLQSVTFATGSQLTTIGASAFSGCNRLTGITIPSGVTSIGQNAFMNNTSLQSVTFATGSQSLTIGNNAFSGCTSLPNITIPARVTSIGAWAFQNCVSLTTVTFAVGSQPLTIGTSAFERTGLTSLVIPSRVSSISNSAFVDCTDLRSVTFANGSLLTSVGSNLFAGAHKLETVSFAADSRLTSIGSNMFRGCTSLTSITIPSGVTSIGDSAFSGCTNLSTVILPQTLTNIGSWAFQNASNLRSISFPLSLRTISSSSFEGTGLTGASITMPFRPFHTFEGWSDGWRRYTNDELRTLGGATQLTAVWQAEILRNFVPGTIIYAGDKIVGTASRLSPENEPPGGRKGFTIVFSDGSMLIFKEHNDKTGTWELYRLRGGVTIQLYNAGGWKVQNYTFGSTLTITAILVSPNCFIIGNPAAEIGNFHIERG